MGIQGKTPVVHVADLPGLRVRLAEVVHRWQPGKFSHRNTKLTRRGVARLGMAGLGGAGQGTARRGSARLGKARHGRNIEYPAVPSGVERVGISPNRFM